MRVAAFLLGLALFGGLIVLAVAGVSAATAVLVTGGAVVVMIGLGNAVGGRHTPNRAPYPPETGPADETSETHEDRGPDDAGADAGAAPVPPARRTPSGEPLSRRRRRPAHDPPGRG